MLETLARGTRNGVRPGLIDKVYAERTLWAAWATVRANGGASGVDRQSIRWFERHGGKGRNRGRDHHRWPNSYFDDLGLLCLEQLWHSTPPAPQG